MKRAHSYFLSLFLLLAFVNFSSCSDDEAIYGDEIPEYNDGILPKKIANNIIAYKTINSQPLVLDRVDVFGDAQIIDNSYSPALGYGIIEFDRDLKVVGYNSFYSQEMLDSIILPNSVTSIETYAFWRCTNLSGFITSENVTKIGSCVLDETSWLVNQPDELLYIGKTFYKCKGNKHTSVAIKNGTEGIAASAFSDCTLLANVEIPNSVTNIGSFAFSRCTGLTNIEISDGVTNVGYGAFQGCTNLASIKVKNGNIKYDSRNNCNAIVDSEKNELIVGCKGTIIPNSVTSIGDDAFAHCYNLKSVKIPSSVTRIGKTAFNECINLSDVTFLNVTPSIGHSAFSGCVSLTNVHINDMQAWCNVDFENIDANPLAYARNLYLNGEIVTDLAVPEGVEEIKKVTFANCGFKSIVIPASVVNIGAGVFAACKELTDIIVSEGNSKYDTRDDCNAIIETETNTLVAGCKNTIIPNSVTHIDDSAFYGCSKLVNLRIPKSVVDIGNFAFYGCSSLQGIDIPDNVTSIGSSAFYGCLSLQSIDIPNNVTRIGSYAFGGCQNLTSITIPNSVVSLGLWVLTGCGNIAAIYSKATTPIDITSITFSNYSPTLYVPIGAKATYEAAKYWKNFTNIVEMEL